jgi:hypothetical protein
MSWYPKPAGRRGALRVEAFPDRECSLCDRPLEIVMGDYARPGDRLFCVIHGQVGLRGETPSH